MTGSHARRSSGFHGKSIKDEDFDEEEVWGFGIQREDASAPMSRKSDDYISSGSSSAWRMQSTAPQRIPKAKTATNQESNIVKQSSAPVNIPDWSKIYGKNVNMVSWIDGEYGISNGAACDGRDRNGVIVGCSDDDDGDDDDAMVPPHEWISRKLARSQISSFSVCEGIGRTLKGRDLSKVRNAILTKTGFLE